MRTDTERLDYLLAIIEAQDDDAAEKLSAAHTLGLKGRPMVDAAMGAKLVEPGEPMPELTALDLAVAELGRIRNVKGFSEERDDGYVFDELANAAACYLSPGVVMEETNLWPWDDKHWKPSPDNRKRELTKGIALALCELDRLIRAERREAIEAHLDSPESRAYIDALCEPENLVCGITEAEAERIDAAYGHPSEQEPAREFRVGDRVLVLSTARDDRFGWAVPMDALVGQTYPIDEVLPQTEYAPIGYRVDGWVFPAEQLEHVDG